MADKFRAVKEHSCTTWTAISLLVDFHPSVLLSPAVQSGLVDAHLPAYLHDVLSCFKCFNGFDDLCFGEPAFIQFDCLKLPGSRPLNRLIFGAGYTCSGLKIRNF